MRTTILLLVLLGLAAGLPPLPGPVVKPARSPRHEATLTSKTMVRTAVAQPAGKVLTLAADYPPALMKTTVKTTNGLVTNWIVMTNLTAFIEVRTTLTQLSWIRIGEVPYPTNGGTLKVPYTNNSPTFFWRAGYSIH